MHGGDCLELFHRERTAALDTPHCKLDQTVCDDVGDMLEVDHGRQNVLSPCTLALVVEGLLVADVGEIAANRATQLIDATILRGDRLGAGAITMPKHLQRIAEHAIDHVRHAQSFAGGVRKGDRRGIKGRDVEMDGPARIGRRWWLRQPPREELCEAPD